MSKSWRLLSLLLILCLLSGALLLLRKKPAEETAPPVERYVLSDVTSAEMEKIVITSQKGTLVLKQENGTWRIDPEQPFAVDQFRLGLIVSNLRRVNIDRVVDETGDRRAEFGLENPQAKAEVFLTGGRKLTFYLGARIPTGGGYYLMMEGDPRICTVLSSYGEYFLSTAADLRDKELPGIVGEELTYFKLARAGKPAIEIQRRNDAMVGLPFGHWAVTKPYELPMGVKWEEFQAILDAVGALRIDEFIDDNPTDLGRYGLAKPTAELEMRDEKNTLHLFFGTTVDGKTYFKQAGSPAVMAMQAEKLDFLTVKPFDLIFRFAYIVDIKKVDRIVIEGHGKAYDLTLEQIPVEGDEETTNQIFWVNGQKIADEPFRQFYQVLIGMQVEGENDRVLAEKPEVRTVFYLNTGDEREVVVSYVPYNDDFYAVFRNGRSEFVIHREQVENMLKKLAALVAND